uniref:Uncharacterized protein n=1 Tax=Anguilla anguilla TaxID=7936 RepID=A0A0E9PI76_ANGAN
MTQTPQYRAFLKFLRQRVFTIYNTYT